MTDRQVSGFWTTDAPLTQGMVNEDKAMLERFATPVDGIVIIEARVYVNGREWHWRKHPYSYGDFGSDR